MREIKFRVWDNVDFMSTPFTLLDLQGGRLQFATDCVIMQYTGRRENEAAWIESNFGKDIYEGDIVKCWVSRYPDDKTTGYIEYNPHAQAFQVRYKNIYNEYVNEFMHQYHFFKVIGNIYQDKHLLS